MSFIKAFKIVSVLLGTSFIHDALGQPNTTSVTYVDPNCVDDYEVNNLKLSVLFPNGYCKAQKNNCFQGNKPFTSIHGLWFDMKGKYSKSNPKCCTTHRYNELDLTSLEPRLNQNWNSFIVGSTGASFRKHEWDTHGICGYNIEGTRSPAEYFQTALDIFDSIKDIETVLQRRGINPSNEFLYHIDYIRSAFSKNIYLHCGPHKQSSVSNWILTEARFCFEKSAPYAQIDCPSGGNCKGYIWIPAN